MGGERGNGCCFKINMNLFFSFVVVYCVSYVEKLLL